MGEVHLRLTNEAHAGLYMLYHGYIEDELSDIAARDVSALIDDWQTLRSALARVEAERDTALAQRDRLMAVLQDEQFSRVEMDRVIATVMTPEAAKEGE